MLNFDHQNHQITPGEQTNSAAVYVSLNPSITIRKQQQDPTSSSVLADGSCSSSWSGQLVVGIVYDVDKNTPTTTKLWRSKHISVKHIAKKGQVRGRCLPRPAPSRWLFRDLQQQKLTNSTVFTSVIILS